jgi:hypothetical protein
MSNENKVISIMKSIMKSNFTIDFIFKQSKKLNKIFRPWFIFPKPIAKKYFPSSMHFVKFELLNSFHYGLNAQIIDTENNVFQRKDILLKIEALVYTYISKSSLPLNPHELGWGIFHLLNFENTNRRRFNNLLRCDAI